MTTQKILIAAFMALFSVAVIPNSAVALNAQAFLVLEKKLQDEGTKPN
jgi:hypothetical protein